MPQTEAAAARRPRAPREAPDDVPQPGPVPSALLALHRLARRLRLVPPEFGREAPVDASNPQAVRAEWRRYFRLWADHAPQEIFALKIGAALLAAGIVALTLSAALLL